MLVSGPFECRAEPDLAPWFHLVIIMYSVVTVQIHIHRFVGERSAECIEEPDRDVHKRTHERERAGVNAELVFEFVVRVLALGLELGCENY